MKSFVYYNLDNLDTDKLIYYNEVFDEYGLAILDGGKSYISIDYCPWCGKILPKSKRDNWFEELEKLGIDNPFEEEIPDDFKTNKWRE